PGYLTTRIRFGTARRFLGIKLTLSEMIKGVSMRTALLAVLLLAFVSGAARAQTPGAAAAERNYPAPVEGDFVIPNFHFRNGEILPELRIHYRTIGTPKTDASGVVRNAILIGHGTGGAGTQFLS